MEQLLAFTVDFGVDTVVGIAVRQKKRRKYENILLLTLCTAALLPELQPAPCFLSVIIGQID